MEINENKTYLCNNHIVKALEIECGDVWFEPEKYDVDTYLNIPDLCEAMQWNNNIKEFLLSKLKNDFDYMTIEMIDEYLKTYSEAEWIDYHKWLLNEFFYIEPIPTNELKEIRKQENKDMIKEIVKGVAAAIGLISALLIFNTL